MVVTLIEATNEIRVCILNPAVVVPVLPSLVGLHPFESFEVGSALVGTDPVSDGEERASNECTEAIEAEEVAVAVVPPIAILILVMNTEIVERRRVGYAYSAVVARVDPIPNPSRRGPAGSPGR